MTIIIDTDPGIDDAIAILYALCSGLPISAITTVAGNLGLPVTTRNAGRITAMAAISVPIHAGAASPLSSDARPESGIHGNDGLGGVVFPDPKSLPSPVEAIAAMIQLIEASDVGAVTLFCLGPLTNLARLLEIAPQTARRLGPVIAMGGAIDEPGNAGSRAEFNIAHDAHAADIVLKAGLDLTLIPLDATRQIRADSAYIAALRDVGTPSAIAVADLISAYLDDPSAQQSRPLHDPCVPLYFVTPEFFEVETRHIDVEVATGALVPGGNPIQVAMRLNAERLRDELKRGLSF